MKIFQTFLIIAISSLLIASCRKKSEIGKHIPANASVAFVLNTKSMNAKLSLDDIKQGNLFKLLNKDSTGNQLTNAIISNPENTGIKLAENLVGFMVQDSLGKYIALTGTLQDEKKFNQFFTANFTGAVPSIKDKINFLSKDQNTIAWKDDRFYIISDLPNAQQPNLSDWPLDTAYKAPVVNYRNGIPTAASLLNMKGNQTLEENEPLVSLMNKKADLFFWASLSGLQTGNMAVPAMMLNLSKLTKDSYYTGIANFEDGKIIMDLSSYSGTELSNIWEKYQGENIDADWLKKNPIQQPAASFLFNFKPEGLKALLELTGMDGMANLALAKTGMTTDDFIKANSGKIMISAGDFTPDSLGNPQPKFLFATGIGNKEAFTKLVNVGKIALRGNRNSQLDYAMNNDQFAIGSAGFAAAYISGKSKTDPFADLIKGGPIGGYINLKYLLNNRGYNIARKDSVSASIDSLNVAMFNNLLFTGGNFKNDAINQHVELVLLDKSTNSLKQLNNYLNYLAPLMEKQELKNKLIRKNDTTTAVIKEVQ